METLGPDREVLNYWHACQHLATASVHAHTPPAWLKRQKAKLLEDEQGVDKVIPAVRHQCTRVKSASGRRELEQVLGYVRINRTRMRDQAVREDNLPTGSGSVEAANKTLITARLKRCGMRWSKAGGRAILTFRALDQSGRFDAAWEQLMAHQKSQFVTLQ